MSFGKNFWWLDLDLVLKYLNRKQIISNVYGTTSTSAVTLTTNTHPFSLTHNHLLTVGTGTGYVTTSTTTSVSSALGSQIPELTGFETMPAIEMFLNSFFVQGNFAQWNYGISYPQNLLRELKESLSPSIPSPGPLSKGIILPKEGTGGDFEILAHCPGGGYMAVGNSYFYENQSGRSHFEILEKIESLTAGSSRPLLGKLEWTEVTLKNPYKFSWQKI